MTTPYLRNGNKYDECNKFGDIVSSTSFNTKELDSIKIEESELSLVDENTSSSTESAPEAKVMFANIGQKELNNVQKSENFKGLMDSVNNHEKNAQPTELMKTQNDHSKEKEVELLEYSYMDSDQGTTSVNNSDQELYSDEDSALKTLCSNGKTGPKRYIGDYSIDDMDVPETARRYFTVSQQKKLQQKKKICYLQTVIRRKKEKTDSCLYLVEHLIQHNFIRKSDETDIMDSLCGKPALYMAKLLRNTARKRPP